MKTIQIISLAAGVAILSGCTSYREKMGYAKPVAFDQLPQPAQQTVRNEIGNKPITRIDQDTKDGQTAYRVEVQKESKMAMSSPTLWVTPSGSILKESSSLSSRQQAVTEPAGAQAPAPPPSMRTDPGTDPDYQQAPSMRTDPDYQ